MKLVLLQVFDMLEYDNMQTHEILGLIEASVKFHIQETDG